MSTPMPEVIQDYVLKPPANDGTWQSFTRVDNNNRDMPLPAGVCRIEVTWTGKANIRVNLPHNQFFETGTSDTIGERKFFRTVASDAPTTFSIGRPQAAITGDSEHRISVIVYPMDVLTV